VTNDIAPAGLTVGGSDSELSARLNRELTAFNNAATGADAEQGLSVRVTDDAGELVGGLTGWTWGGCGGINMLWVRAESRRDGWGSKLLAAAEEEARRRGCTRMVVSSLSFQAPAFYRRHGYAETGRTEGLPAGSVDHHFWKPLDASGPRLTLAAIVDASAEDAAAVNAYEDAVLALLDRHGGRLERRIRTDDRRTEVQIISFADRGGFDAFLADPERTVLRAEIGPAAPEARVVFGRDV
jgi:ribosomal protein S18 acetylase RimI-like enzyme